MNKSAGGIILNGEKVALISENGKYYGFPKGHVESGEDAQETAKREIYEETGLKNIEFIKPIGEYIRKNYRSLSKKKIKLFMYKTEENNLSPIDNNHPEAIWVHKEKVADFLFHKEDKKFFMDNMSLLD